MILDQLAFADRYNVLHPSFKKAFEFLRRTDLASLPTGRMTLDGDNLFANIQDYQTKSLNDGRPEAHRSYIDIQVVVSGEELVGYAPLRSDADAFPFDTTNDIGFYEQDTRPFRLRPGLFCVFFPNDAHAPGCHAEISSAVRKIIVKIRI